MKKYNYAYEIFFKINIIKIYVKNILKETFKTILYFLKDFIFLSCILTNKIDLK